MSSYSNGVRETLSFVISHLNRTDKVKKDELIMFLKSIAPEHVEQVNRRSNGKSI